jgi:phage baseplate assembly protein gpV
MSYELNTDVERTLYLNLTGIPSLNILPANVTVKYKKAGQTSLQTLATNNSNWINLGNGYYTVIFPANLNDVLGTFFYTAEGVGFDNLVFDQYNIIDPELSGEQQAYFQDQASERTVYLTMSGVPSLSILPANVVCEIKKNGQTVFTPKVINSQNWVNLGDGYYTIRFSADDLSRVGSFTYKLSGPNFDNFLYDELVILAAEDVTVKDKCVVKAQFIGLSGDGAKQIRVTARMVEFPASSNGRIVSGDTIYTYLNSNGECELTLLRNSVVLIEVPRAAIRSQITVPDTPTADLMNLLPPFSVDFSF